MTGTPTYGVPGYCAECEEYSEELVRTHAGERALCRSCYDESDATPIAYDDLRAYQCGCRRYEIAVIGSLEEQIDLCSGCVRAAKQAALIDLRAPTDPDEFTARTSRCYEDLES
ncbi:hypothetical protein [Natranaeroarchaeum aerophilus]|uniref:Uncharacterized protein n=1 Tax=Natranaeroarchaeum aerophilus TaxID=2917711 RepID=A0AAE3K674_9EURY|nr:hypothetical protein [Natranaeroarchaeum aerophilus]MCL9812519.1 hypothetical protein [Natranaeroarchaeum aerophilus]